MSITAAVISAIATFFGLLLSFIAWLVRRAVIKSLDDMAVMVKGIDEKIDSLKKDFQDHKEEVLRDYVRKDDFRKDEEAHKEFWVELNLVRERIARLEK